MMPLFGSQASIAATLHKKDSMKRISSLFCTLTLLILSGALFIFWRESSHERGLLERERIMDERVAAVFTTSNCPTLPRSLDKRFYQGPMIDTHIHIPPIPDGPPRTGFLNPDERPALGVNMTIPEYVCMMDAEGTTKVFAFFPVWEPFTKQFLSVVEETMERYRDRFVPFIMTPDHDNDPDGYPTVAAGELEDMLSLSRGVFEGYGEIGLYAREGGAAELPPDSRRLREIYPVLRDHNLMVYVHLGRGQKESFERALRENPDINFIWHGDQLIPYENGEQNLTAIEDVLSKYPNAYYGVDELYGDVWLLKPETKKENFIAHFAEYEPLLEKDLATWKGFIERHPDQVLWGTDRGWSSDWSVDPDVAMTLNTYTRAFIGRLEPAVQEKFAYKNAEQLVSQR